MLCLYTIGVMREHEMCLLVKMHYFYHLLHLNVMCDVLTEPVNRKFSVNRLTVNITIS